MIGKLENALFPGKIKRTRGFGLEDQKISRVATGLGVMEAHGCRNIGSKAGQM